MNLNPIVRRLGKIFLPRIIISLVKNNQRIDRTFQTVVTTFRHMVIVNNRQRPNNAYMGELVRPAESSQVSTTPVVEQLPQTSETGYLRALALIENKALLLQQNQQFYLMSLAKLQTLNYKLTLQQGEIH